MKSIFSKSALVPLAVATALAMSAGFALARDTQVVLSGAEETPAVSTAAGASGTISVADDHSVTGSITTHDVQATAAHIHAGTPGKSGPPVISLVKTGDNVWSVPAGATLTDEQYASYLAGSLYINVHSADHKPGEIRGQLRP